MSKPQSQGFEAKITLLNQQIESWQRSSTGWCEKHDAVKAENDGLKAEKQELQMRNEALLEACREADKHLAAYVENDVDCEDAIKALKQLRQAIAQAEGEKKAASDEVVKKYIGVRLRIYRDQHNITQQQLADKFGVTIRQVIRWEKGESRPTDKMLTRMKELHIL